MNKYLTALLQYNRKIVAIAASLILASTVIHHFTICGRLLDFQDILHHESVMVAAAFFIVGIYAKDVIEGIAKTIIRLLGGKVDSSASP